MQKLLPSALLFFLASLLPCAAQTAFHPDQQFTNEINNARNRLNAQASKLKPAELNRLAETLARSNRLAAIIVEAITRNDFTNAAALLKEFPGTVDDLRQYGQPLLYRSVDENKPDKLDFLLEHKANPDTTTYGDSVLIRAIQYRHWDMAVKLVEAGASVTRTNNYGRTATAMFFEYWYPGNSGNDAVTNFVPLLLEHGLDPFVASRPGQPSSILEECLNREGNYGGGFGFSGFRSGPSSSAMTFFGDLLLTNNPSPARRTPLGDTALHIAAHYQRTNVIEFLLAAGFNIDQTNSAGLTPLQAVVGRGNNLPLVDVCMMTAGGMVFLPPPTNRAPGQPAPLPTMPEQLLRLGAALDVFSAAGLGLTNELAAMLRTNAALANVRDGFGRTPLHYAVLNVGGFPGYGFSGGTRFFSGPWSSQWSGPMPGQPGFRVRSGSSPQVPAAPNPPPDAVSLLLKADANPSAATTKSVPQMRYSGVLLPAGTTPLHLAARNGNTPLIRALLAAHADAKLTDENGDSPLHLAARTWATNALPLLITARAPLEATNHVGQTPLRAAVESSCGPSIEVLLKAGASMTNGLGGNTLLHIAAEHGDVPTATILLKHGLALDARDGEGRTPFQKAAAAKQWNSVVFLRDEGANLNAADHDGNTALHLLATQQDDNVSHQPEEPALVAWERKQLSTPGWTGRSLGWLIKSKVLTPPPAQSWTNTSLTSWLVEHGAKINATNHAGQTPLHVFCGAQWMTWYDFNQSSNRLTSLLDAGALPNLADTNGVTPLQLAGTNAPPAMFAFLLQKSSKGINFADARGRTLLHQAVEGARENNDRVNALLAAGADPNAADKQGRTPFHLAMQLRNDGYDYRRGELIRTLLTNKASANFADKEGRTPLHLLLGATNTYYRPFNQWGDVFADPRWDFAARDRDGQTPLHLWAARMENSWDDLESFKRILTNRSLVNVTNFAGDTPLHIALRANKDHAARALMQIGANPVLKNLHGETALRLAVEKSPAFYDQEVHPPGTRYRFFDSLRLRDEKDVNLWLAADPSLISLTNSSGTTPLMAATDAGNTNIIARLLELGAPLDALSALRLGRMEDFRKLLPAVRPAPGDWLFEAVRFGQLEALQALIAAGGDVQFADADGHSLLFRAKSAKKTEIADWLAAQNCRETFFDAIINGDREQVASLITTDAACVNNTNRNSRPPLYRAVAASKLEIVTLLLEHGAKADAPVPGAWTALHAAAANDAVEIGRLLLKAGALPNAVAQGNMTPLHLAAALGCTNMAELLLQNGADINLIPTQQGGYARNTPLHWAAHLGKLDMFKLLLAHGADLTALNQQNQTPLDLARATARGQHWGFSQPPEVRYRSDQTMFQPAKRDPMIKQLEEAAAAAKP